MSEHVREAMNLLNSAISDQVVESPVGLEASKAMTERALAIATLAVVEQLRIANLIALASVPEGLGMDDIATDALLALQEDGATVERRIPNSAETYQVQAKKPRPDIARALGLEVGDE